MTVRRMDERFTSGAPLTEDSGVVSKQLSGTIFGARETCGRVFSAKGNKHSSEAGRPPNIIRRRQDGLVAVR